MQDQPSVCRVDERVGVSSAVIHLVRHSHRVPEQRLGSVVLSDLPNYHAQLAGRGVIDDVFSLCFGSVEGDGALMLGDVDLSEQDIELRYTSLLSSLAHPHYYSVQLESLWVGDVQLPVRPVHLPTALLVRTDKGLCDVLCS